MGVTLDILKGGIQLNGNPVKVDIETTTSGKTLHYLLCEVSCTNGVVLNGPWTYKVKTSDGTAQVDLQGLFDIDIDLDFSNDGYCIEHPLNTIDLSLKVGERYIENDAPVTVWGETETLKLINGGLSKLEIGHLNSLNTNFYETYILGKKFLTKLGSYSNKLLYVNEISEEVKMWFCFDAAGVITPMVRFLYEDGTQSVPNAFPDYTPQAGVLFEINCHNVATVHQTAIGKTVVGYIIYLDNDQFEVKLKERAVLQHTKFQFKNSLGCFEVLHCYGEIVDNSKTEGETVLKPQSDNADIKEPTMLMPLKSINRIFKVETGVKTLAERKWILDCLRSDEVYWVTDGFFPYTDGEKFLPVNILPGSYTIDDTSEDLLSIEFEFEIAHTDKYI